MKSQFAVVDQKSVKATFDKIDKEADALARFDIMNLIARGRFEEANKAIDSAYKLGQLEKASYLMLEEKVWQGLQDKEKAKYAAKN